MNELKTWVLFESSWTHPVEYVRVGDRPTTIIRVMHDGQIEVLFVNNLDRDIFPPDRVYRISFEEYKRLCQTQ